MPRLLIAVIGPGECDEITTEMAYEVGRLLAKKGAGLVTGGRGGVMEGASRGARAAGGLVVGILPGKDPSEANRAVDVVLPTGMGELRNGLVILAGRAVIAIAGEFGTLSEVGFALKLGKPVIGLGTWELAKNGVPVHAIVTAHTPADAVQKALGGLME